MPKPSHHGCLFLRKSLSFFAYSFLGGVLEQRDIRSCSANIKRLHFLTCNLRWRLDSKKKLQSHDTYARLCVLISLCLMRFWGCWGETTESSLQTSLPLPPSFLPPLSLPHLSNCPRLFLCFCLLPSSPSPLPAPLPFILLLCCHHLLTCNWLPAVSGITAFFFFLRLPPPSARDSSYSSTSTSTWPSSFLWPVRLCWRLAGPLLQVALAGRAENTEWLFIVAQSPGHTHNNTQVTPGAQQAFPSVGGMCFISFCVE